MKASSPLLFVSAAAALEYGSSAAMTTFTPGGSYEPVTVTSQYQIVPTYVPSASSLSSYMYVSTVITDADGKKCTVSKTEEPITVYHLKSTITHTTTIGDAAPTGYYPFNKNGTAIAAPHKTKTWEELYEMINVVPYKNLGPSALPGYPGSGLCGKTCYGSGSDSKDDTNHQPVQVEEYKNGKWQTYTQTFTYGAPTPKATTYDQPGTYTVPSYDVTVHETITVAAEARYTAPAGETVTYGGHVTEIVKPTTITAPYAVCETKGTETKTIIKTITIRADKPGTYTIAKPTTTSYPKETICTYPVATLYPPGVYHHSKETVTITKTKQAYTCSYQSTAIYPSSSSAAPTTQGTYPTASPTKDGNMEYSPSGTQPSNPDPSSDYAEPAESYGKPIAGYVKHGGMIERRKSAEKKAPQSKRLILV